MIFQIESTLYFYKHVSTTDISVAKSWVHEDIRRHFPFKVHIPFPSTGNSYDSPQLRQISLWWRIVATFSLAGFFQDTKQTTSPFRAILTWLSESILSGIWKRPTRLKNYDVGLLQIQLFYKTTRHIENDWIQSF